MEPSRKTCRSIVASTLAKAIPGSVKRFSKKHLGPVCQKVTAFTKQHILPSTASYIKAKVLPFSEPPDLADQRKRNDHEITQLRAVISYSQRQLDALDGQPGANVLPANLRKPRKVKIKKKYINESERVQREKIIQKFEEKLELAKAYSGHLDTRWNSEIIARLAGHVGWITAAVIGASPLIPAGLSLIGDFVPEDLASLIPDIDPANLVPSPTTFAVTQCVQALAIGMHLKGARRLPNMTLKKISITQVRTRILYAIASVIYLLAIRQVYLNTCSDSSNALFCKILPGRNPNVSVNLTETACGSSDRV